MLGDTSVDGSGLRAVRYGLKAVPSKLKLVRSKAMPFRYTDSFQTI
jgi:hypothetical protein